MKKELRAALQEGLAERLPAALGAGYRRLGRLPKDDGSLVLPGEIVYADITRPDLARFVSFVPIQNRNAFTVELGWSIDGAFPAASSRPSTTPDDAVSEARPRSGFVRLSAFYSSLGEDWDVTPVDALDASSVTRLLELEMRRLDPHEARALIRPLFEDAVARLAEHAPGFFAALQARLAR
jgi:hypothetical protein